MESSEYKYDKEYEPKVTTFSDSIVISAKEKYYLLSDIIWSISHLQFVLLQKGIATRGGIELGYIYRDAFMVFGDGLISAYKLESEQTKFPRILVGKKALEQTVKRYDDEFDEEIDNSVIYNYSEEEKANIYEGYSSSSAKGPIVTDKGEHYIDYLYNNLEYHFPKSETIFNNLKKIIIEGLGHENQSFREKFKWLQEEYNWVIERCISDIKVTGKNTERIRRLEKKFKI